MNPLLKFLKEEQKLKEKFFVQEFLGLFLQAFSKMKMEKFSAILTIILSFLATLNIRLPFHLDQKQESTLTLSSFSSQIENGFTRKYLLKIL